MLKLCLYAVQTNFLFQFALATNTPYNMKKITTIICLTGLQFLAVAAVMAQAKTAANTLQIPSAAFKVDGDIKEWGDSLRYYNAESKLNYSLANDKENIYIAVRINNALQQKKILAAGITFTFDPKGKKKSTYTVTFPVAQGTNGLNPAPGAQDEALAASLTKLRQIKVTGFPDIESDVMSTTNTYGFRVAMKYDNVDGSLFYEATVPLKFFGSFNADKDAWSFNFKINGVPRPEIDRYEQTGAGRGRAGARTMRGGGGGGGMPPGGGGGAPGGGREGGSNYVMDHPEVFKPSDFWEKLYLNN